MRPVSKGGEEDQFHERKTRTSTTEETGGLDQPSGSKEGPFINRQGIQAEELEMAWEKVHANRGSGGVDGQSLEEFSAQLDQQLDRLQRELQEDVYQPRPVRQVQIPKVGKPGEYRMLGVPTIFDRVCQQALLNRLEPIFEPIFDDANFGYRRGRSTQDAMRKVWKEIQSGREWIVDADLKDFLDPSTQCPLIYEIGLVDSPLL
jgi:retron-type reverse transcriptase